MEPPVDNNITTVATTETTTTTTTTTEQNIPPFCLKLKFNCKLFSFHKCCKYNLPSSSSASTLVKVTKEKIVTRPTVEVSVSVSTTESSQQSEERPELQAVEEQTNRSILIKKNKSSVTNDKEKKIAPVVEKKAKDSPSSFKYSNQNKSKFFSR